MSNRLVNTICKMLNDWSNIENAFVATDILYAKIHGDIQPNLEEVAFLTNEIYINCCMLTYRNKDTNILSLLENGGQLIVHWNNCYDSAWNLYKNPWLIFSYENCNPIYILLSKNTICKFSSYLGKFPYSFFEFFGSYISDKIFICKFEDFLNYISVHLIEIIINNRERR